MTSTPKAALNRQILILTVWSFLFVAPLLFTTGTNIVTRTFTEGALRLWSGVSPYQAPGPDTDVFHYPTFFAFAYRAFAFLPSVSQSLAWTLMNCLVFWAGVSAWFEIRKGMGVSYWLALAGCAMELDISLRYQQSNALIIGAVLLALAAFRDNRNVLSAGLFALGANLKVLPGIVALFLLFAGRKRFSTAFFLALGGLFLIPVLFFGFSRCWGLQVEHFLVVTRDLPQRHLLDIKSAFDRLGYGLVGTQIRFLVLVSSLFLLLAGAFQFNKKEFPWEAWLFLFFSFFLLVTPRVESPTFVFIAPSYLLLMPRLGKLSRVFLLCAMFFLTVVYTSVWTAFFKFAFTEFWMSKSFATVVIWILSSSLLFKFVYQEFKRSPLLMRATTLNGFSRLSSES